MTQILADFSMVLRLVSSKIYRKLAKRMQRAQSFHELLSFTLSVIRVNPRHPFYPRSILALSDLKILRRLNFIFHRYSFEYLVGQFLRS